MSDNRSPDRDELTAFLDEQSRAAHLTLSWDAARWQHEGSSEPTGEKMRDGGFVQVENGVPYESQRALVQRGHDLRAGNGGFGGYQAIRWDPVNKVYWGASESRKDGAAIGY